MNWDQLRPSESPRRATRRRVLTAAAGWPARGLCRHLVDIRQSRPSPSRAAQPTRLPRRLRWLLPYALVRNGFNRLLEESQEDHWCVGLVEANIADAPAKFNVGSAHWLPEMPRGSVVDPFAIVDGPENDHIRISLWV